MTDQKRAVLVPAKYTQRCSLGRRFLLLIGAWSVFSWCGWATTAHGQSPSPQAAASDAWTEIATDQLRRVGEQPWPGGCAGVAVHRLTGDLLVNFVGHGVWKSSDQGTTWTRLDQGVVSGRGETGASFQIDQEDPQRMAVFSLDGNAGYTVDGKNWKQFRSLGRNWDFGSVDWATPAALVILVGKHESDGEVDLSTDGGSNWTKLPIVMDSVKKKEECMLGVLDARTFVYSYANGIHRSTDQGQMWTKVSDFQPRSKVPVRFQGAHYLCTAKGLLVSRDRGATWQIQGTAVDICQGPFFGADAQSMVTIGPKGIFKTIDGGTIWTSVSDLKPKVGNAFSFSPTWYGGYAWDPQADILYASCMAHPVFRNELRRKK